MSPVGLAKWCRRNWQTLSLLVIVTILATTCVTAVKDKRQRVRVVMALSEASRVSTAVTNYFEKAKAFPSDLSPFITQSHYVQEQDVDDFPKRIAFVLKAEQQRLRVVFDQDQGPLSGKALILTPGFSGTSVSWVCSSEGIPDRYLPLSCRAEKRS